VKLTGKAYEVHLLAVIVLYVLGFVVYLNSFPVPFVFDDYPNIRDNPAIRLAEIDFDGLRAAAMESHANRRPVANISFALNYFAGGYDVKGYHLVNILIHIANGVLVYFIVFIILAGFQTNAAQTSTRASTTARRARLAALFAAGVFIAHPVQIQAVTYIVQRMTSMATMFYLMSLLFYLLGRRRCDISGRVAYWLAALALWLLALGSKEIAATLPVVIAMLEWLLFRDPHKRWTGIHGWVLLFAVIASIGVVFFYLGSQPGSTIAEQYAGQSFTPAERVLTQFRVLMYYLSLLALPYPDRLSLEHTFSISHSLTDPITTLIAAASVLALIIIALRIARRHPVLSLCIMWFLVTLSIESSFIGLELAFEHRLYLPMFAFALGLAYVFFLIPARHYATASALAVVFVVALAAASIVRNLAWQDPAILWADAAAKSPDSYRARNNLGRVLVAQGKREQAAQAFDEAIRINPRYPEPHNNLGTLHAQAGRFEQAYAHFSVAIELNPGYAQAYNNLGVALLSQGRVYEATSMLTQAARLAPTYAKAHANLAAALLPQAQIQAACRHYRMALELDPAVPLSRGARERCGPDSKTD